MSLRFMFTDLGTATDMGWAMSRMASEFSRGCCRPNATTFSYEPWDDRRAALRCSVPYGNGEP